MLSKLKGQLEEMRSKVQFLGLVKKYLQARSPLPSIQRPGAHRAPPAETLEIGPCENIHPPAERPPRPPGQGRGDLAAGQPDSADSRPRSCTRSGGAWSPAPCP